MRTSIAGLFAAASVIPIWVGAASAEDVLRGPSVSRVARMPDLTVTAGDISLPYVVFRTSGRLTWNHRTANVGNAASRTSTDTAVVFGPGRIPNGAYLRVPGLAPGASRAGNGRFRVDFSDWEFGSYRRRICADALDVVPESNEGNNCRAIVPIHIVPSALVGTVTGKYEAAPSSPSAYNATWTADVSYASSNIKAEGDTARLDYTFVGSVSVEYTVRGENSGGCRYSGTATDNPLPQGIRLLFEPGQGYYRAEHPFTAGFKVRVRVTCPGFPQFHVDYRPMHRWFYTGGWRQFQNPGLEALRGKYIFNDEGGDKITWTWNLEAVQ